MHLKRSTTTGFRVRMLHMLFVTTRPLLAGRTWLVNRTGYCHDMSDFKSQKTSQYLLPFLDYLPS